MPLIGTLIDFTPNTTAVSSEVDSNFADIRTAFNNSAVLTDVARTIAVTHAYSAAQNLAAGSAGAPGLYLNGDADTGLYHIGADNIGFAAGGSKILDIGAAGLGVTGTLTSSGALTVSSGGLTVTAGGAAITGTVTVTGAATASSDINTSGGGYQVGGTTVITSGRALQNIASMVVTGTARADGGYLVGATQIVTSGRVVQNVTMDAALLTRNLGTAGQVLRVNSGATAPEWGDNTDTYQLEGWHQANVSASTTHDPTRWGFSSTDPRNAFTVPRASEVVAITLYLSDPITAGTITVQIKEDAGSVLGSVSFNSTDGEGFVTKAVSIAVAVETWMQVKVVGDASLTPGTIDVGVSLEVQPS